MSELNQFVKVEYEASVAVITIDRPPVNALNTPLLEQLKTVLDDLARKDDVRAVIVTGAGEKAFVAGADIKQFPELNEESGKALTLFGQGVIQQLSDLKAPVICAINGFALGGGCEVALACDIRIAAANAKLGLPEVTLGIIPGYGGTQRLARLVGEGKAKELIFSGEAISAEEAYRIGLVEQLVPAGEALQAAKALAGTIAMRGPVAVQKAKISITQGLGMTLQDGLRMEASLFGELCETEDKNEGAKAFLEKRAPKFAGK